VVISLQKSPPIGSLSPRPLLFEKFYTHPYFYQKKLVYLCFLRLSEWKVSQPSPTGLRPCVDPIDLWDISGLKNLYPVPFPIYVWITGIRKGPAKWLFTSTNGSTIFILRIFNFNLKRSVCGTRNKRSINSHTGTPPPPLLWLFIQKLFINARQFLQKNLLVEVQVHKNYKASGRLFSPQQPALVASYCTGGVFTSR